MKGYVPWSGTKFYHSIYCSLATTIGQNFGYPFRLIISFEMAFLTVLLFAVKANIWSEERDIPKSEWFTEKRCCLPGLVRPMAPQVDLLNPIAGLSMVFVELAIIDKVRDGEGHGWQMLRGLLSGHFRKARKLASVFFGQDSICQLRELALRQEQCEGLVSNGGTLETCWETSAQASKLLFEKVHPKLAILGEIVGTLIYLCDAIDDFPKDLKHGDFNPFAINQERTSVAVLEKIALLKEILQGDSLEFLQSSLREVKAILMPWEGRIKYLAYMRGLELEKNVIPPKPPSWWIDETRSKCRSCKCPCVSSVA